MKHMIAVVLLLANSLGIGATWPGVALAEDEDPCRAILIPAIQASGLKVEDVAPVFGCRQDAGGRWYMGQIRQLADPGIGNQLSPGARDLLKAVDLMATDGAFSSSLQFFRSSSEVVYPGRGGVATTVDIASEAIGSGPSWINNLRPSYTDSMELYLTRTTGEQQQLVEYIQWTMSQRDAMLTILTNGMNPVAAGAYRDVWGYMQFPWPWQLADPAEIAKYVSDGEEGNAETTSQPTIGGQNGNGVSGVHLFPETVTGKAGSTVIIEIQWDRLQGITGVAFIAYAEHMLIVNLPMAYIDMEGDSACSGDNSRDAVQPAQRAQDPLTTPNYPPSYLELQVPEDARNGDRLAVCVEAVGFAGDRQMFVWTDRLDVKVVGDS